MKKRFEQRACERCSYTRAVRILNFSDGADENGNQKTRESWSKNCTACEALGRAFTKFEEACAFWMKAKNTYEKRGLPLERMRVLMAGTLTEALGAWSANKKKGK
jgi:hypothetical protein